MKNVLNMSAGLLVNDKYAMFLVTYMQEMNIPGVTNGFTWSYCVVVKFRRNIIGISAIPITLVHIYVYWTFWKCYTSNILL